MVVLSGETIKKMSLIKGLQNESIQPASIDLHLDDEFIIYTDEILFMDKENNIEKFKANKFLLIPRGYNIDKYKLEKLKNKYDRIIFGGVLGCTKEYISIPNNCVAFYTGRSSMGRLFVETHQTAGLLDSGWDGKITLEIVANDRPVEIIANKRIGQIYFIKLNEKTFPYNGKYIKQYGVEKSKMYKDK